MLYSTVMLQVKVITFWHEAPSTETFQVKPI